MSVYMTWTIEDFDKKGVQSREELRAKEDSIYPYNQGMWITIKKPSIYRERNWNEFIKNGLKEWRNEFIKNGPQTWAKW
jgi:hypothetical protein